MRARTYQAMGSLIRPSGDSAQCPSGVKSRYRPMARPSPLCRKRTFHTAHYANGKIWPQTRLFMSKYQWTEMPPVYRPARPLEELALDLLFESYGEHRYNRSTEDYARLSAMVLCLKEAHLRVNQALQSEINSGQQRWAKICRFRACDVSPRYEPFPHVSNCLRRSMRS